MEKLRAELDALIAALPNAEAFRSRLETLVSVYPFNEYEYTFQQVKPACCDVFVWIGVWRDVIRHWVLASKELASNRYFSVGQHRGNVGEGQLHLKHDNICEFAGYEARSNQLAAAIRNAFAREKKR